MDLLEIHSHSTRKVAFGHVTENSKDKLEPFELINTVLAAVELQDRELAGGKDDSDEQ